MAQSTFDTKFDTNDSNNKKLLFDQDELSFFQRFLYVVRAVFLEIRHSGWLQIAVLLCLTGLFSSGYGLFRLISDSHLVCGEGQQLQSSPQNVVHDSETVDANSDSYSQHTQPHPPQKQTNNQENSEAISLITIDLSGAVKNPGLYQLPSTARLGDGIAEAGGLSTSANAQEVAQAMNLAQKLSDGQKIYVPFAGEMLQSLQESIDIVAEHGIETAQKNGLSSSAEDADSSDESSKQIIHTSQESTKSTTQVSINTATAAQLMELKGIGEKRAADIVAGRPYDSVGDLLSKGILTNSLYESVFEQLKL